MPYKIIGNTVVRKDTGEVVGHSSNPKRYLKTLLAVEHGFKTTQNGNKVSKEAIRKRRDAKAGMV